MVSWGSSAGFLNDIKSANQRINQRINEQTNKHKAELNGVPKHTGSRRSFIDQWMHTHGKVATDEPITINLNVNIKHEILVKVEEDLDDLFSDDSELF